jgi:hypothetical protein
MTSSVEKPHGWPFDEAPNAAVITVSSILEEGLPILFCALSEEGWQFLDGREQVEAEARVIALVEAWEIDPTIGDLADLPINWCARRESAGSRWVRAPLSCEPTN